MDEAIRWITALASFDIAWVEEPTSPDDIVGHAAIASAVAPIPMATGEHAASRVIFKQLLQTGGAQIVQIDATRVAGVNESLAILLSPRRTGSRCALTREVWVCARRYSISPCSTRSRCPARWSPG